MRIEALLRTTGQASGLTAEQIDQFAVGLADATLVSTEGAREAATQLLTFKSVAGDTFKRTLALAQDLAAAGFGGLASNAVRLGKALEDPARQLSTLRESGISFTSAQERVIKTLAETGRVAEAQAEVLRVVEEKVGGTGRKEGQGLVGAFDRAGGALLEFYERLSRTGPIETATAKIKDLALAAASFYRGLSATVKPTLDEALAANTAKVAEQHAELDKLAVVAGERGGAFGADRAASRQALIEGRLAELQAVREGLLRELDLRRKLEDAAQIAGFATQQRIADEARAEKARADALAFAASRAGKGGGEGSFRAAQDEGLREGIGLALSRPDRTVEARNRVTALDAEKTALVGLAEAHLLDESAIRARTAANQAADIIAKLKIEDDSQEAQAIRALVLGNEDLRRSIVVRQQARALELQFNPAAAYEHEIETLKELAATGLISQETLTRVTEESGRRRLGASREAADGVRRALVDMRDESRDLATQWEFDIRSMNGAARTFFTDVVTGSRSAADALQNFLNALERTVANRIFDRTIGKGVDLLLDAFLPAKHAGGMVGAPGPARQVSPLAWMGAPRMHEGGLMPGERAIIARDDERVLTAAQQASTARTIAGLAQMAAGAPGVTVRPTVYVNAPGVTARTQTSWSGGELRLDVFVEQVERAMTRNVARGEGMAPVMERRYGLNPAAGAVR